MNRNTTVLVICALFVLADLLVLKQTIAFRQAMGSITLSATFVVEILAAAFFAWLAIAVYRKSYRRQKKPISRERFEPVRP